MGPVLAAQVNEDLHLLKLGVEDLVSRLRAVIAGKLGNQIIL